MDAAAISNGFSAVNSRRILLAVSGRAFDFGGMGRAVQWLMADIAGEYQVSLAASDAESAGIPPEIAPLLANRITVPHPTWTQADARQFVETVKAGKYDLVHFHGGTLSFNAHLPWRSPLHRLSLAGVPWILTTHSAPSLTEGLFAPGTGAAVKFLKTLLAWTSKSFLLTFCRQEVFASDENRARIGRCFPWAKGKMRTIYHSGLAGQPPPPDCAPVAVTVANLGHLAPRKGQHDLLAAFILARQKSPQLRLVLAGPREDEEFSRALCDEIQRQKLEAVVELPGGIADKTAFWKSTDIYVQPSHYEGAPMALMEALWLGKPCIGTRVSGIPEMIEHDVNGLLVEAGNRAAMASAIERLVTEPETRRRFSDNAARHLQSKGMTRAAMSRRYLELYREICPSPGAP